MQLRHWWSYILQLCLHQFQLYILPVHMFHTVIEVLSMLSNYCRFVLYNICSPVSTSINSLLPSYSQNITTAVATTSTATTKMITTTVFTSSAAAALTTTTVVITPGNELGTIIGAAVGVVTAVLILIIIVGVIVIALLR